MAGGPIEVSANQDEPLYSPPVRKPRARTVALVARASPITCQPPGMRVPEPALVQVRPSVEISKVVRQTSGLVPPRSQVIAAPSKVRLWVAAEVLSKRPMLLRVIESTVKNDP